MKKSPHPYCYSPREHGDIRTYLESRTGGAFPLFFDVDNYEKLWDEGFIIPGTNVRISFGMGSDQYYRVRERYELVGLSSGIFFPGRPGIHDPRKILKGAYFSIEGWNKNPIPRVLEKKKP